MKQLLKAGIVALALGAGTVQAAPDINGPWFVRISFYKMLDTLPVPPQPGQTPFGYGWLGFTTQDECTAWGDGFRTLVSERGTKFYVLKECVQKVEGA